MCIGFVLRIIKPPRATCPRAPLTASAKTAGTNKLQAQKLGTRKKPAEHPVRGLKPVHHL